MVKKVVRAQKNEIINNFRRVTKNSINQSEELDQIRKIWFYEKLETDDVL